MALALDETEERSKSSAIVRFVCLSLAGGLNFMTSLVRFAILSHRLIRDVFSIYELRLIILRGPSVGLVSLVSI